MEPTCSRDCADRKPDQAPTGRVSGRAYASAVDWLESRARSYDWDAYRAEKPRPHDVTRRSDALPPVALRAIAGELRDAARDIAARGSA